MRDLFVAAGVITGNAIAAGTKALTVGTLSSIIVFDFITLGALFQLVLWLSLVLVCFKYTFEALLAFSRWLKERK